MKQIFFALFISLLFTACDGKKTSGNESGKTGSEKVALDPQPAAVQNIGADALKEKITSKGDFVLLDVRTPGEWAEGVIEGARQFDFQNADFRGNLEHLDRDKEYVVYCKAGGRSAKAAEMMTSMGFHKVINLEGGIDGWIAAGGAVKK